MFVLPVVGVVYPVVQDKQASASVLPVAPAFAYLPIGQAVIVPVQVLTVSPVVEPYVPAGQF